MTQLNSGQSLASRFTLIRRLGRGGMGDVWLARDETLGSEVVTKIVPAEATPEQISLLRQECRNARRLSHPNIVRVFDFHPGPEASFITMEYVDGGSLCEVRGSSPQVIARTLLPLIDALEYAHREGVIHRDLKCGNVLIDDAGRPRLSDFGIAGLAAPGPLDLQVAGGGSGRHASPQQLAGEAPSVADDMYGLGVLLTDLLSSSGPLPDKLETLISNMTAPDVEERPADLAQIRSMLAQLAASDEEDTIPPQVTKREIRLSPPPRVPAMRQDELRIPRRVNDPEHAGHRRHPYWWVTVTAFVVLASVVFAVFVLLPKWVQERDSPAVAVVDDAAPVGKIEPESDAKAGPAEEAPGVEPAPSVIAEPTVAPPVAQPSRPVEKEPAEQMSRSGIPPVAPTPAPPKVDPKAKAFAEAMSTGLAAYDSGDFAAAQEAFESAVALSPGSAEAADGLSRSLQAQRLLEIVRHRERAQEYEQEERWRDAEAEYKAALALDSTLRFARQGEARASSRARLSEQMIYHIGHPDRMVEDRVLAEAKDVLIEAEAVDNPTPGLQRQIEELSQIVEVASTPVTVVLVSDNHTEVLVYRVGRLGRFDRRELELRPGTYTVVGTRDGYRDVRRRLEVEVGSQSRPLNVRCEEKI